MLKKDKPKEVEKLEKMINEYNLVGILDMHSLPGRQLQAIRDKIRDIAVIKMSKKSLIERAFDKSKKDNIAALKERITEVPALLFANENPFKLFKILKQSRSPAPAKAGQKATKDITIQKGSTGLPPGPAISALQKVGLKTSVQNGKIAVMQDKVVVKSGEVINNDFVNALNLLKIEPMEIGLRLSSVLENGVIYESNVLDIDVNDYINKVDLAISEMINLSINTGYLVPLTAEMSIQKAFMEAKSLALEANIIDKSIIDELLMKAVREATELNSLVPEIKEEAKENKEEEPAEKEGEIKKKEESKDENKEGN